MVVWKIVFLSKWVICRFHVNLPGCSDSFYVYLVMIWSHPTETTTEFLAPDNESQGLFNPIAMTVQKLVKLHRRERLVGRGEKREVEGGFEV